MSSSQFLLYILFIHKISNECTVNPFFSVLMKKTAAAPLMCLFRLEVMLASDVTMSVDLYSSKIVKLFLFCIVCFINMPILQLLKTFGICCWYRYIYRYDIWLIIVSHSISWSLDILGSKCFSFS